MRRKILEYSFKHELGHIASAFSMVDYLKSVFKYIKKDDKQLILLDGDKKEVGRLVPEKAKACN